MSPIGPHGKAWVVKQIPGKLEVNLINPTIAEN